MLSTAAWREVSVARAVRHQAWSGRELKGLESQLGRGKAAMERTLSPAGGHG